MLTIEYEQSLVETAVFLAVRRDERLECELHQAVDQLYEIPDEELRQREFVPVFRDFFTKLGFDRLIAGLVAERPLVGELVDRCVVREAARKKAQSAELLVQSDKGGEEHGSKTLVIQLCPQSFIESEQFVPLMRRELLHVADMLDERFGYLRETFSGQPSRQNLQRDRYRVLWDIYVEGRLEREQVGMKPERERLKRAFGRVFADRIAGDGGGVFQRVFDASSLAHRDLMDWARDPSLLFDSPLGTGEVAAGSQCADSMEKTMCTSALWHQLRSRSLASTLLDTKSTDHDRRLRKKD
ncbi:MAG: hypothetical protein IID42_02920 [Planctomycetes bacterium]|nr:hypothetical protein [Planctomycetota bacterium]